MVELCPDLQSPDFEVACSSVSTPPFGAGGELAHTGIDVAAMVALAIMLVGVGIALAIAAQWWKRGPE